MTFFSCFLSSSFASSLLHPSSLLISELCREEPGEQVYQPPVHGEGGHWLCRLGDCGKKTTHVTHTHTHGRQDVIIDAVFFIHSNVNVGRHGVLSRQWCSGSLPHIGRQRLCVLTAKFWMAEPLPNEYVHSSTLIHKERPFQTVLIYCGCLAHCFRIWSLHLARKDIKGISVMQSPCYTDRQCNGICFTTLL